MNMFIEFIPLSLAYNLHAHVIQIWHVHSWHTRMHLQTVVHMSSAYTRALHGRFYVINPACTCRLACVWSEKCVVSSPCCTHVLSSLNWAVPYVCLTSHTYSKMLHMYIHSYTYIRTCIHTCIHAYIHTYICTYMLCT